MQNHFLNPSWARKTRDRSDAVNLCRFATVTLARFRPWFGYSLLCRRRRTWIAKSSNDVTPKNYAGGTIHI